MTPQCRLPIEPMSSASVTRIISLSLGVVLLMGGLTPIASASLSECQGVDPIQGDFIRGLNDTDASFQILMPTLTLQQRLYGTLPDPVLKATFSLRGSRFGRGDMENRDPNSSDGCWGQSFRKNLVVKQAMIKSNGKGVSKGLTQVMKAPALPYNGQRQVFRTRATLPGMGTSFPRQLLPSIIGPVQENATDGQSNMPSPRQAMVMGPSSNELFPLFEGYPISTSDRPKSGFWLPGNESLRMNMTTTQVLHGGNCANGCP
jgi:hypothetical protein